MARWDQMAQAARGAWVERLHALWGETWVPGLELGRRAREADESRLQLDADQLDALEDVTSSDRSLVRGRAGSGKTLIAAEAARRAAARGQKVLFL
jgi:superfamily II DNA or RNA helicase